MVRRLTPSERETWDRLTRSVRPLRPSAQAEPAAPAVPTAPDETAASAAVTPARAARPVSEPPLTRLEERTRRRLARGLAEVDARIDLHGMRQERAFKALMSFLKHAQLRGHRLILVITGRGRESDEGRGVLRQVVPAWLARPEFRDLVMGFEEAGRRHGGSGALYVRVRRRRQLSPSDR
jgi:DNA-nicking Smr family endonuclease